MFSSHTSKSLPEDKEEHKDKVEKLLTQKGGILREETHNNLRPLEASPQQLQKGKTRIGDQQLQLEEGASNKPQPSPLLKMKTRANNFEFVANPQPFQKIMKQVRKQALRRASSVEFKELDLYLNKTTNKNSLVPPNAAAISGANHHLTPLGGESPRNQRNIDFLQIQPKTTNITRKSSIKSSRSKKSHQSKQQQSPQHKYAKTHVEKQQSQLNSPSSHHNSQKDNQNNVTKIPYSGVAGAQPNKYHKIISEHYKQQLHAFQESQDSHFQRDPSKLRSNFASSMSNQPSTFKMMKQNAVKNLSPNAQNSPQIIQLDSYQPDSESGSLPYKRRRSEIKPLINITLSSNEGGGGMVQLPPPMNSYIEISGANPSSNLKLYDESAQDFLQIKNNSVETPPLKSSFLSVKKPRQARKSVFIALDRGGDLSEKMNFEIRKQEIQKQATLAKTPGFFAFLKNKSSEQSSSQSGLKFSHTIASNPLVNVSKTEIKKGLTLFASAKDPKKDEKYFNIENEEALKADPRTWDAGDMKFSPWDIARLNHLYAMGKKNQGQEQISPEEEEKKNSLTYKVTQTLRTLHILPPEKEEDIDEIDEIKTPPYSSGQSEADEEWDNYQDLDEQDKKKRMLNLWRRLTAKAVGGAKIIIRFAELSDNIAMFGASRSIKVEIEDEIEPLPIILLPENKFRMAWNLVTMVLLLYTASFVPYRTSFIEDAPPALIAWEWVVDALFVIDIVINFISAYENSDKNLEVRLKEIARAYVTSWFVFDLAAVFPFQLLESSDEAQLYQLQNQSMAATIAQNGGHPQQQANSQSINRLIRLARLPRLYRLMRIIRLFKILSLLKNNASFRRLQELINMNVGVQRILMIAAFVVFTVHLMACLFFLASKFEDEDQYNWVVFAGLSDEVNSYQYLVSVYWALQTLTTVGYGDITPRSVYERILGLIWMIIGVGFYSFTIGNLASIFNSIDVKAAHLQQKLAVLEEFSKRTRLPEDTQNRVKIFLENNHGDYSSLYDQKKLLAEVPASMRAQVVSHTHAEIIKRIKFFNQKDPAFLFTILPLLKPMKVYAKDQLYCEQDYAEEVFFIFEGRIKLHVNINNLHYGQPILVPFNLYVEGSYFGDSDIFVTDTRNIRDSTAVADVRSELLVVTRKELFDVFKRFKEIGSEMKKIGVERWKHHKKSIDQAKERNKHKLVELEMEYKKRQEEEENLIDHKEEGFFDGLLGTNKLSEIVDSGLRHSKEALIGVVSPNKEAKGGSQREEPVVGFANQKLRMKAKQIKGDTQEEVFNLLMSMKDPKMAQEMAQGGANFKSLFHQSSTYYPGAKTFADFGFKKNIDQNSLADAKENSLITNDDDPKVHAKSGASVKSGDHNQKRRQSVQKNNPHNKNDLLKPSKENADEKKGVKKTKKEEKAKGTDPVKLAEDGNLKSPIDNKKKIESIKAPSYAKVFKEQQERNDEPLKLHLDSQKSNEIAIKASQSPLLTAQILNNEIVQEATSEEENDSDESTQKLQNEYASKMQIEENDDEDQEDLYQQQNEEILAGFQENMALIAGNSFEILQLYEMIRADYSKVTQRVQTAENHVTQIQSRTKQLEDKLKQLVNIIN